MTHSATHRDFESKCRLIIGWTVQKVQYAEIDYHQDNPQRCYKTNYREINSVDFSVIISTSGDNEVEFFWDDEFYAYGVGVKINEKSVFSGNRKWDVSQEPIWRECIGQKIVDAIIYWDETWVKSASTGFKRDYTYPLALGLLFSNAKQIIISAGEFKDKNNQTAFPGMDNLLVTSSQDLALKTQMIFSNEIEDKNGNRSIWQRLAE
jgi:hypothetical protein